MIDYLLVVVLIGILVIIYRQMIKVDDVLDTIEHPDVLVIYEDQYKDIKKYESKKIKCMSKQDIYQFEQSYQYVILCCQDDYYNLLMNYRIQRDMFNTHVYALCGEQNYIELYSDNIDIFQKKEDIERVIKNLYDQKKNEC
ncbi:hypothetical protein DXD88_00865 [Coprobacillus sp. TM10-10]|jgi:hypothetical protein|uniref:Uncharacterized protein n=1 Tax=Faecalibacillus intestinalis TaxID=1982626 RepID=A0A2T3G4L1_9FIRM|nr:hypothetical protein [Faecalibacillus intestinalis]RGE96863.1 hypothetical protein DW660_03110 [Coprobacillus sp. AM23-9LB]RGG96731.1 hypothetical protein DWW67_01830 [Coprobacillus sp. AF16-47]RGH32128.1 hypothetical protein DWV15_02385 [Coprobacillus sp. AF02-13]RGI06520.1 hypothetical protein DXD88_00865 [Coprobacillus sp. TM10-10]RHR91042.1 hypothetical protein DWW38_04830 [Coprobacillus sp. AF15-30]